MTHDRYGRRTATFGELPDPDALPPAMADLAAAVRDLVAWRAERAKASLKARQLTDSRPSAVQDDRLATARALREGKPDPNGRLTKALDERIAQVKRQEEAWGLSVAEAEAAVRAACQAQAAEYDAVLADMEAQGRAATGAALDALQAAVVQLEAAHNLRGFVESAADPQSLLVRARVGGLRVHRLVRQSGEPYTLATVLDALRPLAEPPAAAVTAAPQRPLAQRDTGQGVYVPGGR